MTAVVALSPLSGKTVSHRLARGLRALIGVWIVWLAIRSLLRHWSEVAGLPLTWRLNWLTLGESFGVAIACSLAFAASWHFLSLGWRQRISFVGNLGIWARVHLLAYRPFGGALPRAIGTAELFRVAPSLSAGSVILPSMVSLAVGGAVGIILTMFTRFGALAMTSEIGYVIGIGLVVSTLLLTLPMPTWRIGLRIGRPAAIKPTEPDALAAAVLANLAGWLGVGFALRLLAQGAWAGVDLPWLTAAGIFAFSDAIAAVFGFLPVGLGVREGIIYVLLRSSVGTAPAIGMAVMSRVLFTAVDLFVVTPLALIPPRKK